MKKIVFACAFLGLLGLLGTLGSGCGGNACEAAGDRSNAKLESCGVTPTVVSGTTSVSATCTDADAKYADCVATCTEAADCNCLNPDKAMDCKPEDLTTYSMCVSKC